MNTPRRDPAWTSDQDGASQPEPFVDDPEDRRPPGEADERLQPARKRLDASGEITDALPDAGQEAGEDGKAFTAEETIIQRTSADEPGSPPPRRPVISVEPAFSPSLNQPAPPPGRDTDLIESSGELTDVIQDANQEPGADNTAQHAEDRAPDG